MKNDRVSLRAGSRRRVLAARLLASPLLLAALVFAPPRPRGGGRLRLHRPRQRPRRGHEPVGRLAGGQGGHHASTRSWPSTTRAPLCEPTRRPRRPRCKVRISSKPWTSNTISFVAGRPEADGDAGDPGQAHGLRRRRPRRSRWARSSTCSAAGARCRWSPRPGSQGPFDYVELRPVRTGGDPAEGRVAIQLKTSGGTHRLPGVLGHHPRAARRRRRRALGLQLRARREVRAQHRRGRLRLGHARRRGLRSRGGQGPGGRRPHLRRGQERHPGRQLGRPVLRGYTLRGQVPGHRPGGRGDGRARSSPIRGKPITAYFSGHSGGYTTDSAWSGTSARPTSSPSPIPGASRRRPRACSSAGPGWNWTYTISAAALSAKVNGNLKDIYRQDVRRGPDQPGGGRRPRHRRPREPRPDPPPHRRRRAPPPSRPPSSQELALGLRSTLILDQSPAASPWPLGEFYDVGPRPPVPRPDRPRGRPPGS